jgi:DNA-binding HxlR family transcriptional regulator
MEQVGTDPTELAAGGTNAVGRMLGLLGDEWTLLVIQQALLGATRYGDFTTRLPISNSVLTRRLQALTEEGLLSRTAYQSNPERFDYLITPRGRSLWPVLLSIWEWERHWVPDHAQRLPAMHHTTCGADFAPLLTCHACTVEVTEKSLVAQWGPSGSWPRSVPGAGSNRRRPTGSQRDGQAGLFPQTMSVLGNRWACALLVAAFVGTTRFSEFQSQLAAPPNSVADRLQTFRANDILTVTDRSAYRLTEKGRAFLPVLCTALQWAQRWFHAEEGPAVLVTHDGCGQRFDAVLSCDQCAEPLAGRRVVSV